MTTDDRSTMTTNRPTYAPDRRPGDPSILGEHGLEQTAYDLIALHLASGDALTIASLIEAGAAALRYAPIAATDVVELNSRQRHYRLAFDVAAALRDEVERHRARDNERHLERAKAERKATAKALREQRKDAAADALEAPDIPRPEYQGEQLERLEQQQATSAAIELEAQQLGLDTPASVTAWADVLGPEAREQLLDQHPDVEVEVEPEPPVINTWRTQHHVGTEAITNQQAINKALEQRMRTQIADRGGEVVGQVTFTWDERPDGSYDITGVAAFDRIDLVFTDDDGNPVDPSTAPAGALERTRRR